MRTALRIAEPGWWNAPVPAFGDRAAWLAIVGLAPGRRGANRTGRPFTGDFSGELFYSTLIKFGLARGTYQGESTDRIELLGTVVLNAVKCLPPSNRPSPQEILTCRNYLEVALLSALKVKVVVALGQIAYISAAKALGISSGLSKFAHAAEVTSPEGHLLLASYHCSRQNTNSGRLTRAMYEQIFERALDYRNRGPDVQMSSTSRL